MATRWSSWYWQLGLANLLAIGGAIAPVNSGLAQIIPDSTLGAESSVITFPPRDQLAGGATRGANLFQSFQEFSVPTGSAAYFNNASDIQNIISRVTGASVTYIDGLIRANGIANLFLINPNGFIFGPNAALDIGGSFVGTTASSLNFADGTQFSATAPQTIPLMSVGVPTGLQFGATAGSILNQSLLAVDSGRTLALIGGDVRLNGGAILAPGGNVELGGLSDAGSVGLSSNDNQISLSFPNGVARADVSLSNLDSNPASVNVAGSDGGSIAINARNIDISGGSSLNSGPGTGTSLGFPNNQPGDISLNAQGAIALNNGFISNRVPAEGVGNSGDINITTGSLAVTNGGLLSASTGGQGNAGNVNINALNTVSLDGVGSNRGSSGVFSTVEPGGVGNGGDINITTGSLDVMNGASLGASTTGSGGAGNIQVAASSIRLDNKANLGSNTTGAGGNIILRSGDLVLRRGSNITTNATGTANAGNITIDTGALTILENSGITANASTGAGGSIQISASSIQIREKVPEPGTVGALLLAGVAALGYGKRQKQAFRD